MPKYVCDLHMHTTRSDGSDSPRELIDNAAALGMEVIAITDHDIRPPETVPTEDGAMDAVDYAHSRGVRLIRGIEISCETDVEDTHVVGFGCDWSAPFFAGLEDSVAASKIEGYQKLAQALTAQGMPVSWDEVLDNNGSPVPEQSVQKKMIFELMARKGYAKTWNEAKLMVKNSPVFAINRRKPSAVSVIRAIGQTGGISILAHPYLIAETVRYEDRDISRDEFIRTLIGAGLNGIEANYTYDKTSYGGVMTKGQIAREVIQRYEKLVHVISGGSDYHADHRKGVASARQMGEEGIEKSIFDTLGII